MMIAGGVLLVVAAVVVMQGSEGEEPAVTGMSTTTTATSTDIFAMEPIIPEAKVSTEGWKTCRNEEYGYEFKFPGEWKIYGEDARSEPDAMGKTYFVRESEECNGEYVLFSTTQLEGYPRNMESIMTVNVYKPGTHFAFADLHTLTTEKSHEARQKRFVLSDNESLLQAYNEGEEEDWYITSWAQGNVYRIHGVQNVEQNTTITTLLSTFHFLEATSTAAMNTTE